MNQGLSTVDHNALKTNQAFIIGLLLLAFLLNRPWLVAFVGLTMMLGSFTNRPGFMLAYRLLLQVGIVKADQIPDHPEPHRFAQSVGAAFLLASLAALALGSALLGWALAWIVIALAALNLFAGFCLGCAMYYWLNRLGLPGFNQQPLEETRAGWRAEGGDGGV
jgi:hypothetical protein